MASRKSLAGSSELPPAGRDDPPRSLGATHVPATVHFRTDGFTVAHWHSIGIVVWARAATPELVRELDTLPQGMTGRYSRGSHINIVVEGTPPPTPEGRLALRRTTERHNAHLVCMATLIEGSGFRASAIRSLTTALQLILRRDFKSATFGDLVSLAHWLVPIHCSAVGEELDPAELVAVLRELLEQQASM